MILLKDQHKRRFEKLRISLTKQCNFNCIYCVGKEHLPGHLMQSPRDGFNIGSSSLSLDDYKTCIDAIHQNTPLKQIRFTGGEPLLNPHSIQLIRYAKSLGIADVGLTTNAWYLEKHILALKEAQIDSLNISLDGIDDKVINSIAGHSKAHQIKETIILAKEAGLPVKINAVIIKGKNSNQIMPLLEFARLHDITLRYIEFMPMGQLQHSKEQLLIVQNEILERINSRYNFTPVQRKKGATANYWQLSEGGTFGIIANHSSPFCSDCNRLRLDSAGHIYGCISSSKGYDLKEALESGKDIKPLFQQAMNQKQTQTFTGSALSMKYIGG